MRPNLGEACRHSWLAMRKDPSQLLVSDVREDVHSFEKVPNLEVNLVFAHDRYITPYNSSSLMLVYNCHIKILPLKTAINH